MAFPWILINKNFNYPAKIINQQLGEFIFGIKHVAILSKTVCMHSNQTRSMSSENQDISTLIAELTGCSSEQLLKVLNKSPQIKKLEKHRIQSVFNVLQSLGFKKEDISDGLELFGSHPITLKNHFMVLEEAGADCTKVTPLLLYKFTSLIRRKISVLKTEGVIRNIDPVTSFASYLGMPAPSLPSCNINDSTLGEIQVAVLKAFIAWRLDLTTIKSEESIKRYSRLRHKSFRLMQKTLKILENDLGFTKGKIQSQIYLLHVDPDNLQQMLKQGVFGSLNAMKVFNTHPKILTYPVENIVKINALLKKRNIPEEAVAKVLDIYTLSPDSIEKRLNLLDTVPHFSVFHKHPSILSLVLYQKKATNRLLLLKKLKMKCISLHILSTHYTKFDNALFIAVSHGQNRATVTHNIEQRADLVQNASAEMFTDIGEDRTRGDDIVHFLCRQLSTERKKLRANLNRHPFWHHVSIMSIKDSLEYLYSKNFKSDEIIKNIHIVLYSKNQIAEEMAKLEQQTVTGDKWNKESILPLTLYFIEQPYHFSGGGIWSSQSP